MSQLDLQPGFAPSIEKAKKIEKKVEPPNIFKKADRELSELELEAYELAVKFNKGNYKQIKPVAGTLGYIFRNLAGGNESVAEFIRNASNLNATKFIRNFLILWNSLDDFSKRRVDIFDWFCLRYNVHKSKFFGVVSEGMYNYEAAMRQISLAGYTDEFIDLVKRMAGKERNTQDRLLLAKMLKLDEEKPLVSITDNSINTKNELHIHEKASVPSFISSIRRGDEGIRREVSTERLLPEKKVLALSEATTNFINVELVEDNREEELCLLEDDGFENEMRKSIEKL